MTTTLSRTSTSSTRRTVPHPLVILVTGVFVLAGVLRWWRHDVTFDVFVDEFVYEQLGASVRDGGLPRLSGGPFFLHPPGFSYLLAGWEELLGLGTDGGPVRVVMAARGLNVVLGAATAAGIAWLVGRRSWSWGLAAGLVLALEPFALRQNGRVLLDTAVVFWVVAGLLVLRPTPAGEFRRWRPVLGGLLFGLAVLTKDKSVMLTVLPLVGLWFSRPGSRSWVPRCLGASFVPYGVYLVAVALSGHVDDWAQAKFGGLLRAVGAEVTTGFTAPGAPSLLEQILRQLADFGATYVLLALGTVCAVLLLRSAVDDLALLGLVHLGAFVMLAYSAVAGTLEEHFLYYVLVPSVGTVFARVAVGSADVLDAPRGLWASVAGSGPRRHRRGGRPPVVRTVRAVLRLTPLAGAPLLVLTLAVLALDGATYVRWHATPDDGFSRVRAYLQQNAPAGTGVVITQGTSEFVFADRWDAGPWTEVDQRREHDVQYLVVPWREVYQGYTYVGLTTVRELVAQAEPVLVVPSRSYGEVALYRLPPPPTG